MGVATITRPNGAALWKGAISIALIAVPAVMLAQWDNTAVLSTLDEKHVAALKGEGGGYIAIYGSLSVIGTLTGLGAIDELHLLVHPIVLGAGKSMFDRASRVSLELVSAESFKSGVVLMKYRPTRN